MRHFLLAIPILLAPIAALAKDPPAPEKVTAVEGITEYRLDNGLRILLFPDDSKPRVTVNCTIFVGSRHEGYGETGMAHLLEHMLFKGTPAFRDVPKALRDHGANFNGSTWTDRTNYYQTMPATDENLEFGIHLEADRLMNSFIKREDLISEMTVVRNEFEQGENDPEMILSQRISATAYEWHNYGKSTIGNRADIERVPIDNLQRFYKRFYQPDNAMLVVAGKFDEKKALEFIQKYFGPIPRPTRKLDQTYTEEPTQDGERLVTLRRVGTVAAVGAAYHVPAGAHPDFPAVELLGDVLAIEPAGRLYKALVLTKKATAVNGGAIAWHDPGLLEVGATCEPKNLDAVRDTLVETLESLARNPVTDEEIKRVKTQWQLARDKMMADSTRVAINLSEWAGCGDWRLFFLHRDRIGKVTAADVNRVAAKYLLASNRTLGVFVPTEKPVRAEIAAAPNVAALVKDYKGAGTVKSGEAFDPTPANLQARLKRTDVGGIKVGMLAKQTRGERVLVRLALRFGNEESLKGQAAALDLMPDMLTRGTKKHTRQQLSDALDQVGADLSLMPGDPGVLVATLQVKRSGLAAALDLLAEVLREPTFPADEFDLFKAEYRAALDKQRVEPSALAVREMERRTTPYPPDDPRYVPTFAEELDRLQSVTLAQVRSLYEKQLSAGVGEVALVGDFDPTAVVPKLEAMFKGWTSDVPFRRIPKPAHPSVKGAPQTLLTPDKADATYIAGMSFAVGDAHPDFPALDLGNYILGGGTLVSRLGYRVREKDGLSYGVTSHLTASPRDPATQFMIFASCNPANIEKVDRAVAEELDRMLKDGPAAAELADAQKAYLKEKQVGRTNDGTVATQIIISMSVGRTFEHYADLDRKVAALTPEAVKAALQKHIDPKRLVVVRAGDFKK